MSEFEEALVLELYRDQQLERARLEELARRLREDAAFSQRFAAEARLQGTLAAIIGRTDVAALLAGIARGIDAPEHAVGGAGSAAGAPDRPTASRGTPTRRRLRPPHPPRSLRVVRRLQLRTCALLAAVLVMLVVLALHLGRPAVTASRAGAGVTQAALAWVRSSAGAEVIQGGSATPAPPGTALQAHQELTIGPDGHAELVCADGTLLTLAPGSRLRLAQAHGLQVQLGAGRVAGDIATQPAGQPMIFTTPSARAVVVGTRLSLEVIPGGSRLEVESGHVRFAGLGVDLQATEIGPGQSGETAGGAVALRSTDTAPAPWAGGLAAEIAPQPTEAAWERIAWMTDLGKARQQAAATGRLLVIWSGWGHPLGMAGAEALIDRQTCWADPTIQQTLAEHAIAVAVDAWFLHQEQDDIGRFYAGLVQQSGHHGGTTQGIYCCDAQGVLRGFCASGQDTEPVRALLAQALAQPIPSSLPPADAVRDARHDPQPLPGDLILLVQERTLLQDPSGWRSARSQLGPVLGGPSREYLWLHNDQWQALIPAAPRLFDTQVVPLEAVLALAQDALLDTTTGEATPWERQDLQSSTLTTTVDALSPSLLRLRLDGGLQLASAHASFAPAISGMLEVDRASGVIISFDCVILGAFHRQGQDPPAPHSALALHLTLAPAHDPIVHPHIARDAVRARP